MPYYIQGPDGRQFLVSDDNIHPQQAGARIRALYGPNGEFAPHAKPTLGNELIGPFGQAEGQIAAGIAGLVPVGGQILQSARNAEAGLFGGAPTRNISNAAQNFYQNRLEPGLNKFQVSAENLTPTDTGLGSQALRLAGGIAPLIGAGLVGGIGAPIALMGAQGAGQHVQEANQANKPVDVGGYLGSGVIQAALGAVPLGVGGRFAEGVANPIARRLAKAGLGAAVGAPSFGAAQLASNIISQNTVNPNQPTFQGVGQAALQGGLFGLAHGVLTSPSTPEPEVAPGATENKLGQKLLPGPNINIPAEEGQIYGNAMTPEYKAPFMPSMVQDILNGSEDHLLPNQVTSEAPEWIGASLAPDQGGRPAANPVAEQTEPMQSAPVAQGVSAPVSTPIATPEPHPLDPIISIVRGETKAPDPGRSLLQFIAKNGGVNDQGGELAAMDADKWHTQPGNKFQGKLVKDTGLTLGDMAEKASDAGYQGLLGPDGRGDSALLLDSMRQELGGNKSYLPDAEVPLAIRAQADDLDHQLTSLGIDPRSASREAILSAIGEEQDPVPSPEDYGNVLPPEPPLPADPVEGPEPSLISQNAGSSSGADNDYLMRGESAQPETNRAGQQIVQDMRDKVQTELNRIGMKDVSVNLVSRIRPDEGSSPSTVYGSFHPDAPMGKLITLAHDVYEPNITDEQLSSRVMGALNHEVIHALRSLDVLRPSEWNTLEREAARRPSSSGETYQDRAEKLYPELSLSAQREEAIAEMFREWRDQGGKVNSQPTGILNRLFRMVKGLLRGLGRANADEIFQKIVSGEVGSRERGLGGMGAQDQPRLMAKPTDPDPNGVMIRQYNETYNAMRKLAAGNKFAEKLVDHLYTGLFDEKAAIAGLSKVAYENGDSRIKSQDPRSLQKNMPGKKEAEVMTYMDHFVDPINKSIAEAHATDGMLRDLEAKLPKNSYLAALRENFPGMSPAMRLINLMLHANHAEERNLHIEHGLERKTLDANGKEVPLKDGSGMPTAEADQAKAEFAKLPSDTQKAIKDAMTSAYASIQYTKRMRIDSGLDHDWDAVRTRLNADRQAQNAIFNDKNRTKLERQQAKLQVARIDRALGKIPDFKYYVPLRGELASENADDPYFGEVGGFHVGGRSLQIGGKEDPTMLGRTSHAGDIVGNIHQLAASTIDRKLKNEVDLATADATIRAGGEIPGFTQMLPQDPNKPGRQLLPTKLTRDANGRAVEVTDQGYRDPTSPYLRYKRNGEEEVLYLENPMMRLAMKGVPLSGQARKIPGLLDKVVGAPMHIMRELNVGINPFFGPKLAFRHTGVAGIYGERYGDGLWKDISANTASFFSDLATNKPMALQRLDAVRQEGGLSGLFTTKDISKHVSNIQDAANRIGWAEEHNIPLEAKMNMVADYGRKLEGFMRGYNNMAEYSTRVAVYEALKAKGMDDAHASQGARDLTIDFDQHGSWGPGLSQAYLFASATLQDALALTGSAISSPSVRKALAGIVAAGLLEAPLNHLLGGRDPDPTDDQGNPIPVDPNDPSKGFVKGNWRYDEIGDEDKVRNIVLFVPGTTVPIKIPVLYGPAAFYQLGREIFNGATGRKSPLTATSDAFFNFLNSFSVLGGGESGLVHMLTPSVARPIEEVVANTPWWGTGQIHPQIDAYGEGKAPSQVHSQGAAPVAVAAANALHNLSGGHGAYVPGKIEIPPDDMAYLINQYIGGMGQSIMRIASLGMKSINPQAARSRGQPISVRDVPIAGQFIGTVNDASINGEYEKYALPVIQANRNLSAAQKLDDGGIAAAQVMARSPNLLQQYEGVQRIETQRRDINNAIKAYQALPADQRPPEDVQQKSIIAMRSKLAVMERNELAALKQTGVRPSDY